MRYECNNCSICYKKRPKSCECCGGTEFRVIDGKKE
jgi:hypothetical protein